MKFKNVKKKLDNIARDINLKFNKKYIKKTTISELEVSFLIDSLKEYQYRFENSYACEPLTTSWIMKIINSNENLLDIGANVGAYSLLFGKKVHRNSGEGHVIAVEPESLNFSKLNKNIHLNKLSEIITPYSIAIGSKLSVTTFHLSDFEYGAATHSVNDSNMSVELNKPAHIQGVLTLSLDEFTSLLPESKFPNHIKIDVDGLESQIILNSKNVLKNKKLKSLLVEVEGGGVEIEIVSYMTRYQLKLQEKEQVGNNSFNLLFVRENG